MDDRWNIQQPVQQERAYQSQFQSSQNQNKQNQTQNNQPNTMEQNRCLSLFTYAGHIFLLGLVALVSELVNLQAGAVLEVLLSPFKDESGSNLEQDLLGDDFDTVIDDEAFFEFDGL